MKMSKAVYNFYLYQNSGSYSTSTAKNYQLTLNRLAKFLQDPDMENISLGDLRSYMIKLRSMNRTEATRQYYWKVIKSFFGWAERELKIKRPDTDLEMPTVPETDVLPYTEQEINKIIAACDCKKLADTNSRAQYKERRPTALRDKLMIYMLLDTGVRISELYRMRFGDVNLENQSIHVRYFETGKKSKDREVYIGKKTTRLLIPMMVKNEDLNMDDYIFLSSTGYVFDRYAAKKVLSRIGERAGVPNVGAHRFRHTFAIQYLRNGGDIYTLRIAHTNSRVIRKKLAQEADKKVPKCSN